MALPLAPFNAANSIFIGLAVAQFKFADDVATGATADVDQAVIELADHGLIENQTFVFVSGVGFTGLVAGTTYYAVDVVPNVSFSAAATLEGAPITITLAGTVGIIQPLHVFEVAQIDDDPEQELKHLPRPNAKGRVHNARTVLIKANEKWMYALDEVKRLRQLFNGSLLGSRVGTATIWLPDVDDADGICALKSPPDFKVTVTRDGKMTHGNSEFSKTSIRVDSNEPNSLIWVADAAA